MNKEVIIQKLQEIKPGLHERYGVTELALFGSYSRDEQTDESDIDIMVSFNKNLGSAFLDMMYELDKLFNKEIQLVSKDGIKPKYFQVIKDDLIYA